MPVDVALPYAERVNTQYMGDGVPIRGGLARPGEYSCSRSGTWPPVSKFIAHQRLSLLMPCLWLFSGRKWLPNGELIVIHRGRGER